MENEKSIFPWEENSQRACYYLKNKDIRVVNSGVIFNAQGIWYVQ